VKEGVVCVCVCVYSLCMCREGRKPIFFPRCEKPIVLKVMRIVVIIVTVTLKLMEEGKVEGLGLIHSSLSLSEDKNQSITSEKHSKLPLD